ncbi:hypothetical protein AMJ86_10365 [bacterium SM23_57]|nr:MAG: hypothetical protein AMJ86_10365 [bacterium SM23_57]
MTQTRQKWDAFLSQLPNPHILQSSQWGEFKSIFGWNVHHVIFGDTGVQILFRKLPLGFSWGYIPKGPVGINWEGIWPLVDRECRRRRSVFLKVEPDVWEGNSTSKRLLSSGFHLSPHHIQPPRTLILDLRLSEEEILSQMKQKTRYNIRLASKKGVLVSPSDDIHRFYQLMVETGDRNEYGIHSLDYYQMAYDIFHPSGLCEMLLAEYESKLLAALLVFRYGKRAWYFYGASSQQHRNLMASYAVQWKAIQWAQSQGCLEYDLWGVPDEKLEKLESGFLNRNDGLWGVYRFKRGFGGQLKRAAGAWDRVYQPAYL